MLKLANGLFGRRLDRKTIGAESNSELPESNWCRNVFYLQGYGFLCVNCMAKWTFGRKHFFDETYFCLSEVTGLFTFAEDVAKDMLKHA